MRRSLIVSPRRIVGLLALAALPASHGCQGSGDSPAPAPAAASPSVSVGATTSPAPAAAAAATEVVVRELDAPAAELLGEAAIWDLPEQRPPRPRDARFTASDGRGVTLRGDAAFAVQVAGRSLGQLQLTLQGAPKGIAAKVHLFSLHAPIADLARSDTIPADLQVRIHSLLAQCDWSPGTTTLITPIVESDRAATSLLVSVETATGGELRLDHLRVDEFLPGEPARHLVGAETRPSLPLAAGTTRSFALPPLAAGATVEFALAPPEGMVALRQPLTVRCTLAGSRERELVATFHEPDGNLPIRRFRDLVFHVDGSDRVGPGAAASRAAALEIAVAGPAGTALFVTPPLVLPRRAPATPPNLLLFSIDTLRADRVGAWGSTSGATPNLDAFALRCVRFARAYSPANFTTPAHASMLTGLEPAVHGANRFGERRSIRGWPTLASACAEAGMTTAAFTGGGLVDALFGFDEGFDRYRMLDPLMTERNPRYSTSPRKQMPDWNRGLRHDVSLADVTGWLEAHVDRRFLLFFHTYHAHDYSPEEPVARRFGVDPAAKWPKPFDLDPKSFGAIARDSPQLQHYSRLYDASLSEVDAAFGALLATLERTGLLANTVVLITADHGEGFKEHGFLFHTTGLHDEVLHVPLLLYVPGLAPAVHDLPAVPTVIDTPVSLVDVAPTLLELAGVPPLPQTQGRSLVPLLRGGESDERPLLAQDAPPGTLTHSALVSGRFKYIRTLRAAASGAAPAAAPGEPVVAAEHLYDLVADPRELHDLASDPAHADVLAHARAGLDRKLAEVAAAAERARARRDQQVEVGADLDAEIKLLGY